MTDADATELTDSKQVYERVREFIARRTVGHENQRAVKEQQLKLSYCAHGNMTVEQVDTALKALAEQGVIIRAEGWLTIDTTEDTWYRQVIEWCADREDPPRGLIGACNQRKQQLQQ